MKHTFLFIHIATFLVLFFLVNNTFAQKNITLKDAIEVGLKNRKDLQNLQINTQISANEVEKIKTRNLPKLDANADFRYNTQLQTSILPAGAFGPDARAVRFGTNFNNLIGINATYDIYNPTNLADKKIALQNIEIDKANIQKSEIDIKHSITQAYYLVLLNQEKLEYAQTNIARTEKYIEEGKVKLKEKTILQTDFDKLILDNANAKMVIEEDTKNLQLSKLYLVNQMGVEENINISENLSDFIQNIESNKTSKSIDNRIELKQEQLKITQNQLNIDKLNRLTLPTISLYGNYSIQNLSNNFEPFASNVWFPFSYVGLKVNVNLFDGFLRKKTKTDFQLKSMQTQNTILKLKNDFQYELQSSVVEIQNIGDKIKNAKENITLAENILKIDMLRFKEGKINASELKNTEYSLQTAQNNAINLYYNFLVAELKYQKAMGE